MDLEAVQVLLDRGARVSITGIATSVRSSSGTPSRSARPGRRLAPTPRVTARLTSATAMSMAGTAPEQRLTTTACRRGRPACCSSASGTDSTSARGEGDRRDVVARADGEGDAARPVAQRRAEADGALELAAAFGDQVKAGIALALGLWPAAAVASTLPRDVAARTAASRAPAPRWRCDTGCAWRNPWPRNRRRRSAPRRPGSRSRRTPPSRRPTSAACW